jgi:hypothetical protein
MHKSEFTLVENISDNKCLDFINALFEFFYQPNSDIWKRSGTKIFKSQALNHKKFIFMYFGFFSVFSKMGVEYWEKNANKYR